MKSLRHLATTGGFTVELPSDWRSESDGEDGILISHPDGPGLLHLMPFERDAGEDSDPAEELYAFLTEQEIEIEEDEVTDFELGDLGELALCEYVAEEADEAVYWMVGVATGPGRFVFASYSCVAGDEESEAETVKGILSSLRFDGEPSPG